MELRQLRYFEAVARLGHFTNAALEVHVAQSALSHQVRRLEQELGVELLHRSTRSVESTEAGALVAARARAILAEVDALHGEIDELRGLVRGRVTVGVILFGGELDIPALLARFSAAHPHVEVGVRDGTAGRMLELLGEGRLDVAFALEAGPVPGVERVELSSEELVAVMRPGHALSGRGPLALRELAGHPLIAFERGSSTRRLLDAALTAEGIEPRIALQANDPAVVRALAAGGLAVAVMPRSFVSTPGPRVSFRALIPELQMTVALWWPSGRRLSPAARAFVEFVRS